MPPILHRHLRTGLDYDGIDTTPEDLLESLPDEQYDSQQRAAKRRRIETIATSLIKGTKPIILSATLRGPFEKWENPWGARGSGKDTRAAKENNSRIGSRVTKEGGRHRRIGTEGRIAGATVTARSNYRSRTTKDRGVGIAQEPPTLDGNHNRILQQGDEHEGRDLECVTGPAAEERSAATEYFSAPDQRALNDDSPSSRYRSPERFTDNVTRTAIIPAECVQQRASLQSYDPPTVTAFTLENTTPAGDRLAASYSTHSSARRLRNDSPDVLQLQEVNRAVAEGYQSARRLAWNAINQISQTRQQGTPILRENVLLSAAVCGRGTPIPVTEDAAIRTSNRRTSKEAAQRQPISHDLVASPALGSSIGFTYRKTEKTKAKDKGKPRLVTFSSSPRGAKDSDSALEKVQSDHVIPEEEDEGTGDPAVSDEVQEPHPDVNDIVGNGVAVAETYINPERHESRRSSRLSSNYSTQAALMLAQLEFQEDTAPSVLSDTPRAHWQSQDDKPQPDRLEPGPVITPFQTFNAELDRKHLDPPGSSFSGPLLSTQDLFAAASPFAFSTTKKKSVRPQRSTLRFSILSNERGEHGDGGRSPMPSAERIPLKDRNCKVSFRNAPFHGWQSSINGSQTDKASQHSMAQSPKPSGIDVQLSLLDFHTSLDDLGPNGDLDFTDRFLRNLDGMN
jgi:hypothetical protein